MTSCPPNPHQRSHHFRSAVAVAEGLVRLAQSDLEDPRAMLVPLVLPDPRAMPVSADLLDRKALEVFRVLLDPLVAELEEPLYLAPKDLGALLALLDLKATMVFRALPDLLVPPEQMVNLDLRVRMARSVLLDLLVPRVLPDLLESVALPVRMR